MQINNNELEQIAATRGTSLEIMTAIVERSADENEMQSIWTNGFHSTEILARAWELADEDTEKLFWGPYVIRRQKQDSPLCLLLSLLLY